MSRKGDRVAGGECGGLRPVIGCRPDLLSSLTRTQLGFAFCMVCEVGTRVPMAASRAASPAPDGDGEACRRGGHTLLLPGARLSVARASLPWHETQMRTCSVKLNSY